MVGFELFGHSRTRRHSSPGAARHEAREFAVMSGDRLQAAGRRQKLASVIRHRELSVAQKVQALVFGTPPMRRLSAVLTRVGERHGIDALIYNPAIFLWWHGAELSSAPAVARALDSHFPSARRYTDVGAGTGVFAAALRRRGCEVQACEHDRFARWLTRRQGVRAVPFDLQADVPALLAESDVAYCFEVAEHVPPELGERLVEFLAGLSPVVVFTAATPGQGGHGHINEQPRDYWRTRFADRMMSEDPAATARLASDLRACRAVPWLGENVMVFRRRQR